MAEADKRHYNLCSGTNTVQLPVQIHMSNDSEFLTQISQNDQNSDSDDSAESELDCSAVAENSDTEHTTSTESKQSTSSTPSTSLAGNALSDAATQQAINLPILAQLSSISDRLNVIESKKVKKHLDPKKKREFPKIKPALELLRSHCHRISALHPACQVYSVSDKMYSFKVKWIRD